MFVVWLVLSFLACLSWTGAGALPILMVVSAAMPRLRAVLWRRWWLMPLAFGVCTGVAFGLSFVSLVVFPNIVYAAHW